MPETETLPTTERLLDLVDAMAGQPILMLVDLVADPDTDLYARIPHGDGQTGLREALLVADHNAYHLGQMVFLRRCLGAWEDK